MQINDVIAQLTVERMNADARANEAMMRVTQLEAELAELKGEGEKPATKQENLTDDD